jgi:hypothetical protein
MIDATPSIWSALNTTCNEYGLHFAELIIRNEDVQHASALRE